MVGVGSPPGPVGVDEFADHVFGAFLVNDWSARDIQAWESTAARPVPGQVVRHVDLALDRAARGAGARQDRPAAAGPEPLPYLAGPGDWGLDLAWRSG